MTDIGTSTGRSAAFAGQRIAATLLGVQDAIDAAAADTQNSGRPGPGSPEALVTRAISLPKVIAAFDKRTVF